MGEGADGKVQCKITSPPLSSTGATPRMRVFVIDVSGSMSTPAMVSVAGGVKEGTGQNILDTVCTAVIAAIATLSSQDSAAIVSYSDNASTRLPPTPMTPEGKERARQVLLSLTAGGTTHMWAGLEMGLELVRTAQESIPAARCASVDILTDGQPNVDPPNMAGFVASLRDYQTKLGGKLPALVNTLGFGSNIQQQMLDELARAGGGHFSFIPSPDMVATNFVNSAAAFGSAFTILPTITAGGTPLYGIPLPNILPYGASRSFLVTLPPGIPPSSLALKLSTGSVIKATERNPDETTSGAVIVCECRTVLVTELRAMQILGTRGDLAGALAKVRTLSERFRAVLRDHLGADASASLACLLSDVEGQVAIALSSKERFQEWGSSFLLSLASAHEQQMVANFKDPGLQGYSTPVFELMQGVAGTVFRKTLAEAIAACVARAAASVRAAPQAHYGGGGSQPPQPSYMPPPPRAAAADAMFDPAGGCVYGAGVVTTPNGDIRMDKLLPGTTVTLAYPEGAVGVVTHVARTQLNPSAPIVVLKGPKGNLQATGWHPVWLDGEWVFPMKAATSPTPSDHVLSLTDAATLQLTYVYTVAIQPVDKEIKEAYGIIVDGIPIITLGHGIQDHPVLAHSFFGSQMVIERLEDVAAWCAANNINPATYYLSEEGKWGWSRVNGEIDIIYRGPALGH